MSRRRSDLPDDSLGASFAARLAEDQADRGWSDAGLARRASEHYPISASTVWKIKHAEPIRRVDIDEAAAIAKAFDFATIEEFLDASPKRRYLNAVSDVWTVTTTFSDEFRRAVDGLFDVAAGTDIGHEDPIMSATLAKLAKRIQDTASLLQTAEQLANDLQKPPKIVDWPDWAPKQGKRSR